MTFTEAAQYYYNTFDMNCAEAVLHGANDVLSLGLKDEDYKLLGAFGAGCGCGSMCGAVAAVVAAIGRVNIGEKAHGSGAPEKAGVFIREIRKRFNAETCAELHRQFHSKEQRCAVTIAKVTGVLDELWNELH